MWSKALLYCTICVNKQNPLGLLVSQTTYSANPAFATRYRFAKISGVVSIESTIAQKFAHCGDRRGLERTKQQRSPAVIKWKSSCPPLAKFFYLDRAALAPKMQFEVRPVPNVHNGE